MTVQGFATIPRAVLHDPTVSSDAKMVYLVLSSHVGAQEHVWPSHATIAGIAGLSVATVKRRLRELRDRGLVEWETRIGDGEMQRSNDYRLIAGSTRPQVAHTELQAAPDQQKQVAHTDPPVTQTPSSHRATPKLREVTETPGSQGATNENNKETNNRSTTRGTRLPADWLRSDQDRQWQATEGIPDDFARQHTAEFRDYWISAPGARGVKLDWSATWRNWMRRAWRERAGQDYRRDHALPGAVRDFDAERRAAREAAAANPPAWMMGGQTG